jgi:hypothetical protein
LQFSPQSTPLTSYLLVILSTWIRRVSLSF